MAPKTPVKKQAVAKKQAVLVAGHPRRSVDSVAEFIGSSLGELMNRKDALARQLASVEKQIAAAGDQVAGMAKRAGSAATGARDQVAALAKRTSAAASGARKAAGKSAGPKGGAQTAPETAPGERRGNRKKKRPQPPDDPMIKQTTRAATAQVKARTAQQMRTTRRSGNR